LPYLVDASNLGGVLGGAAGARDAEAVVRFLAEWSRRRRGRVVALFDGDDDGRLAKRYGPLEVAWSGAGRSADDEIARRVAAAPGQWTVVTDDGALRRRCRADAAQLLAATDLVARVAQTPPRRPSDGEKPPPESDRDYWRGVFRDGD
jgi:hypothetical protein